MFSVGLKLVPCLLLTYLSLALIRVLIEADKRKERLKNNFGVDVRTPLVSTASRSDFGSKVSENSVEDRRRSSTSTSTNNNQNIQMVPLNNSSTNHKPSISSASNNLLTVPPVHKSYHSQSNSSSSNCHQIKPDDISGVSPPASSIGTCVSQSNRTTNPGHRNSHGHGHSHHSDRTTRMLLAILILFLITEMPSGLLALASGILGEEFFQSVYHPLGNILDILALINSGINFILYCCMSRLFRTTFAKIFCIKSSTSSRTGQMSPSNYPRSPSTAIHVLEGPSCAAGGNNFRNRRKSSMVCSNIIIQSVPDVDVNQQLQTSEV